MDIVAHGAVAEAIIGRLQQAGHKVSRQQAAPAAGPRLVFDSLTLDLAGPTPQQAKQYSQHQPDTYLDLAGHWHPAGQSLGFILYAGGSDLAITTANPILNTLAPADGIWLTSGPAGSATFVRQYMDAIGYSLHLNLTEKVYPPHWPALLQHQQQLLIRLQQLARRYVGTYATPSASEAGYAAFPDTKQAHFALALAQWLLLLTEHCINTETPIQG
ncbi:hypothetical protein [Craterilacuibacter sp.]|uniref:hypothetical protein n=1 Tax=Craterilacuibacter sp. TaxID=2870909 RepID=UPI003F2AB99C